MSELLLFRLFGPFASWGEIAVGEQRPSAIRPTRSALLGLLGAALGLERGQDAEHLALSNGLAFAVRIDSPGVPAVDYQTANYRHSGRKELIHTRADELRVPRDRLSTVQSWRHYRSDAFFTVAANELPGARFSLATLRDALLRPVFPLSLGRKACVPALPLDPQIVAAASLLEAFAAYDDGREAIGLPSWFPRQLSLLRPLQSIEIGTDLSFGLPLGGPEAVPQLIERRDEILSRRRWRFAARTERLYSILRNPAAAEEVGHVPEPSDPG
jgi:CRISPR system Cascade subunit CasD